MIPQSEFDAEMLKSIIEKCRCHIDDGKVASYIPELSKVDKNKFGIAITTANGVISVGDYNDTFTIQSIVKPFILLLALKDNGEEAVRNIVGVEATGKPFDAFNYSDQALTKEHINPMINTGAIALCTLIKGSNYQEKLTRLLDFMSRIAKNSNLEVDKRVYLSEKKTGNKNRALAYMLKAYGLIDEDIEELLDFYFQACSIKVTCVDLANMGYFFASKNEDWAKEIVDTDYIRKVNAILATSGMYDGSGAFALNVGVLAKSGVGGGIMSVVPKRMGLGVFSPSLDNKGNSMAGIKALELISKKLDLSIY